MIGPATALAVARGLSWKMIGYIALAGVIFAAGWAVNGWRWEKRWAEGETDLARAREASLTAALEREHVLQDAFRLLDEQETEARRKTEDENRRLRDAVAAGDVRLRVAAHCPAATMPGTAAGPGLDHGAGAELDPAARPTYHALREGLERVGGKLSACQARLAVVVPK